MKLLRIHNNNNTILLKERMINRNNPPQTPEVKLPGRRPRALKPLDSVRGACTVFIKFRRIASIHR